MNYDSTGFFGPGSGKKQGSRKKPGFNFGKKRRPGFGGGLFGPGFGGGSGGGLFGPGFGKGLAGWLFSSAFEEFLGSLLGGLFGVKPNTNRARYNARRIPGRNRRY